MLKLFASLISVVGLLAPLSLQAHANQLEPLWETAGFMNPESVVHDDQRGLLYVSNVNGKPDDKDGNGFISTMSTDGTNKQLEWVGGLNAPKGLAIHGDRLYVADIDTLIEIDITTGDVLNRYTAGDAKFLNDVTVGKDGSIYVSDMVTNRIHRLRDGNFSVWLESERLEHPNGLLVRGGRLIVGSWGVMTDGFATETPGHLKTVALDDKTIESVGPGEPVGNLDGVEADPEGDFYVTDWMAGKLLHITGDGESHELLDLNAGSADLEYLADDKLLLIPMMNDNSVKAYRIN